MISRTAEALARQYTSQYPVLLITGPRQSGKTTLSQMLFADKPYANLEALNTREFAQSDPVGFLNQYPDGVVLDEVQRVPQLLSEIQVRVDKRQKMGMYVLTGSHQMELHSATAQSLAGRVAIIKLLPLSLEELQKHPRTIDEMLYEGFYPRIVTQKLNPVQAYGAYVETYLEKDLRQMTQIKNLSTFQKFLKLCAGRVGQLLNIDQLGNDAGVSSTTIRHWISALEASFIITLVRPYFRNVSKRLTKSPKIYFHDVGIACFLLGIESPSHLRSHPLRGSLFENLIISDLYKARWNRGLREQLCFYRDHSGNEVDAIIEAGGQFLPIEIKSGETISKDFFKGFQVFEKMESSLPLGNVLIHGGSDKNHIQKRNEAQILSVFHLPEFYASHPEFFRPVV